MTKGHGQILNFLVNASPPKALDEVTLNCRCIGNMNILCRSRSNNLFSCKCIFSLTVGCSNIKLCWYKDHMMSRVLSNILCDLDPKVKVK